MRWNKVITLLKHSSTYQDEAGEWHEGEAEETEVFCNEFSVNARDWAASVDVGRRADAAVLVHADDYEDQEEAVYNGIEYAIERIEVRDEFIKLQLGRLISNDEQSD